MRYLIPVLLIVGCTEPTVDKMTTTIELSKGRADLQRSTLSLKGSHEIKYPDGVRVQAKLENGKPVAALIFKDSVALYSITSDSKNMKITWYDSNGNTILTSKHKTTDDVLGRLLRFLPEELNAQTGCWASAGTMTLTASAVTLLIAELAVAVRIGNLALASALRVKLASATAAASLAYKVWEKCAFPNATGSGGGGGFYEPGTVETTKAGTSQGGCYIVLHTVYSLSTGLIIKQWEEQICK